MTKTGELFKSGKIIKSIEISCLILSTITSVVTIPIISVFGTESIDMLLDHYSVITYQKNPGSMTLKILNQSDKPINNLTIIVYPFTGEFHYEMLNFSNIWIKDHLQSLTIQTSIIQRFNSETSITIYSDRFNSTNIHDIYAVSENGKVNIVPDPYNTNSMSLSGFNFDPVFALLVLIVVSFSLFILYVLLMRRKLKNTLREYLSNNDGEVPFRKAQILYLLLSLENTLDNLKPSFFYRDIRKKVNRSFKIQLSKDLSVDICVMNGQIKDLLNQIDQFNAISSETKNELKYVVRGYVNNERN